MKRWAILGLVALVLTGCGAQDPLERNQNAGGIVVGSADFAENELLMEIYAEALRGTGAEVRTQARIGAREFYVSAVRDGELAVVPEYTGNLLKFFKENAQATESRAVYDELKRSLPGELDVLEQSQAENSDVLAVTEQTAASGLRSMADLGPRCGELVLGAPAEWKERWENTIAEMYGCRFKEIRSVEAGTVTVDALVSNQIQVANLFTTSSAIKENNLVELDDPKNMYPAQHVVPLINKGKLNQQQIDALNKVSRALNTEKLTELDRRVEVDKASPADVAKEFVASLR